MWIDSTLKCPDQGAWVAMVRVDSDGNTHSLGYVSLPFREQAAQALEVEVRRRDQWYGLDNWTFQEVVDFVLKQMHPDLPATMDSP